MTDLVVVCKRKKKSKIILILLELSEKGITSFPSFLLIYYNIFCFALDKVQRISIGRSNIKSAGFGILETGKIKVRTDEKTLLFIQKINN